MRDKIAALVLDDDVPFRLERNLLKDRAMDLLRDHIVSGRIPAGAKVVERDVAQLLGISRAPVRDALIQLETEGLVVSKPSGNDSKALDLLRPCRRRKDLKTITKKIDKMTDETRNENRKTI